MQLFTDSFQNITIEERVALLEIKVADIEGDISVLIENVDFLFDETVIQDERIFTLEQTSIETNEDVDSNFHLIMNQSFDQKKHRTWVKYFTFHFRSRGHNTCVGLQSYSFGGERRG